MTTQHADRSRAPRVRRVPRPVAQGPRRARPAPGRRRRDDLDHHRARHVAARSPRGWSSMRFMLRVEVADVTADWAVVGEPLRAPSPCRVSRWPGATRGRGWSATPRHTAPSTEHPGERRAWRELLVPRADLAAAVGDRPLAGTWAAEALRVAAWRPAARVRDRPPHHPPRGRLAAHRRAPAQGLLPRAGDRRPRAQPRPAAAAAGVPAPRRLGSHPAGPRRPRSSWTGARSAASPRSAGTTRTARSPSPWSSATSPSTRSSPWPG